MSNYFKDWNDESVRRHNEQIARRRTAKACDSRQAAEPERPVCHEPLGSTQGKEGDIRRCRVSIVSFRRRGVDPDNLCCKWVVDALRYSGIIQDDTAKHIELQVRQEKSETEYTEVTVEQL